VFIIAVAWLFCLLFLCLSFLILLCPVFLFDSFALSASSVLFVKGKSP